MKALRFFDCLLRRTLVYKQENIFEIKNVHEGDFFDFKNKSRSEIFFAQENICIGFFRRDR